MPSKRPLIRLSIDGGWSSDAGPSTVGLVRADGLLGIPWLIDAENVVYALDGWPQKMPGATATNAAAIGAGATVSGIFDYWRSTAAGSPVQRQVIFAGTQIYNSSDNGATWTSLVTGLESAFRPSFVVMDDLLVMATNSSIDVPQSWNGTDAATSNLAGSPPNFAFVVEYNDRLFAAGVDTNKSRLYYTILGSATDWTGAGSGSIDIAPDDGDVITGLFTHKDQLWVLKGENRGSMHFVSGSAPTGSDAFALNPFIADVGCTSHHSIIRFGDDVAWADHNGIHSLKATAAFGNFNEAFLSREIASYFANNLNHGRFAQIRGLTVPLSGLMLWSVPRAGSTTNNATLMLDFRFTPMRWALWPAFSLDSLALVRDAGNSNIPTPWGGTYTGFVYRMARSARNIAGAAYTDRTTFPYLGFGDPTVEKAITVGRVSYAPLGDYNFTFGYTRDGATQQTETVAQGGVATLGSSTNQFVLDTSTLGGGRYLHRFFNMDGRFREIQFQLTQGVVDQGLEPHGLGFEIEPVGVSQENP